LTLLVRQPKELSDPDKYIGISAFSDNYSNSDNNNNNTNKTDNTTIYKLPHLTTFERRAVLQPLILVV